MTGYRSRRPKVRPVTRIAIAARVAARNIGAFTHRKIAGREAADLPVPGSDQVGEAKHHISAGTVRILRALPHLTQPAAIAAAEQALRALAEILEREPDPAGSTEAVRKAAALAGTAPGVAIVDELEERPAGDVPYWVNS